MLRRVLSHKVWHAALVYNFDQAHFITKPTFGHILLQYLSSSLHRSVVNYYGGDLWVHITNLPTLTDVYANKTDILSVVYIYE